MAKIVRENESFDVLVLTPIPIKDLAKQGKVAGEPVLLAQVGVGVAVKEGAPKPDISSREALKATLLNARKIAYIDPASGGSSGVFVDQLLYRLGIQKEIEPKAVLVPGGLVAERVVNGEADLGIHQISEILAVKGAVLVGPLPGPLQNYTVYAGGISANTSHAADAKKLLDVFTSDKARQLLKEKGMEPPQG
jgi:molybdate transport system substrate-binding protein